MLKPLGISAKLAIVTGGSKGIGHACTYELARRGIEVVIAARDVVTAKAVAQDIETHTHTPIHVFQLELTEPSQCKLLFEYAAHFKGHIDYLINNAAHFAPNDTLSLDEEEWLKTLRVNVFGPYICAKEFVRLARAKGREGTIVNISSTSSKLQISNRVAYSASKAALDSLTRSFANEWANYGIRVNSVAPGHTNTEGIKASIQDGFLHLDEITKPIPMKRLAEPNEIAELVAFLCSDDARYITGQTIFIDGGRTNSWIW
ncbi:MAG: SDR family oxidoreductase [Chloroflexi bacterium]|nr:SDR family oxidoreductase [Chloroflexota bacterium]